jgi:hypothetical protein
MEKREIIFIHWECKKRKNLPVFYRSEIILNEKENTWVIEMNKKIIWIVGKRY